MSSDDTMSAAAERPNQWLHEHARNVTSQFGEDGILAKVLEVIGARDRWCVEFGAWDGEAMSNTHALVASQGYSAVLIEADGGKFKRLAEKNRGNSKIVPIRAFVGYEGPNRLDALLAREAPAVPRDFDLLSIDIDGNDYHVWDAVIDYRPKVVVIEYNPSIANAVEFVQPRDPALNQGASLRSMDALARRKGYELVAVTTTNGIFVERKYFDRFGIRDNSVAALRTDESLVTHVFSGYDGTVFVRGYGKLVWHEVPYDESRLQQLPRWLRGYPGNYGRVKGLAVRAYRALRGRFSR